MQPQPPLSKLRTVMGNLILEQGRVGQIRGMAVSLPEESERDSEPDDAGFLQLLAGKVRTAAGSTQSVALMESRLPGETHCALFALAEIWGTGETPVCPAAGVLPLTFSSCLLAEKLLHMQS